MKKNKKRKNKKRKKNIFVYGIILFLMLLIFQAFLLGTLNEIIPSGITLIGLPFNLMFFIWGLITAILVLILTKLGVNMWSPHTKKR